ncbi:MAG: hypothetical protein JWP61_1112 [Friedmanniella sp.]|nr:hypothetical protein [Friedmanniella sp.]
MPSLLSARRTAAEVSLHATTPRAERPSGGPRLDLPLPTGWLPAAVAAGLATAALGWFVCAALSVLGWLAAGVGTISGPLTVGTHLWLLVNGVSARLGVLPVTLVPWGATVLVALALGRGAAYAARRVRPEETTGPGLVSVVVAASYLVPVLVTGVLAGEPWQAPAHWAAVIVVLLGSAYLGAARPLGATPTGRAPAWLRPVPRAVLAAQLTMLAGGAAVLLTALLLHLSRVADLTAAVQPGVAGGIALLLAQLVLVPNAVVWAASYALGPGFTLGLGSVVAPAGTELGVLPGLPLLGSLPGVGPGSVALLWWLAIGVLAGAVAAFLVVRTRPQARFDETALVGGVTGLLAGLVFVALAWATGGSLGAGRLVDLGPRLLPLLVMGCATLGLAGAVTGLALGLLRRHRS